MRSKYFFLIVAVLSGVFAAPAVAITPHIISIPAPLVNLYAKPSSTTLENFNRPIGAFQGKAVSTEKTSSFIINFNTIPESYRPAIQAALDVWSFNFSSTVAVNVDASWVPINKAGVLAAATPGVFQSNFPNIPDKFLFYAPAMANSIAGKDLDPGRPEITITINSVNASSLYLGVDGKCPSNQYDLESMILHEVGHGLGFLSNADYFDISQIGNIAQPTPFDAYSQLPDGRRLMDLPSPSPELGRALTNNLFWSGVKGVAANNGNKPKLYTPSSWDYGSSLSHLDEATFSQSGADAMMTPQLGAGEIFHSPGPIALGMLQDMMAKPPAGIPTELPSVVQNVQALVGEKSATILFDPPINARISQVSDYVISVGSQVITVSSSPAVFKGLKNGKSYSFSIEAKNAIGRSAPVNTNSVVPQATWKSYVVDPLADGKYFATGVLGGKTVVAYTDSKRGTVKLATLTGNKWVTKTIDGDSIDSGKTTDDVSGAISLCISKTNKKEVLNIFYPNMVKKNLRAAVLNGTKWTYSIVDGDAQKIQDYKEVSRVRTGSNVSVSNACAYSDSGLQVFYRDESQGILLGATWLNNSWQYEIVDGDSAISGRSTGDLGSHLKATAIGSRTYVFYDSPLISDSATKNIVRGEVRLAYRDSNDPADWKYQVVQGSDSTNLVAGYDVNIFQSNKIIYGAWLGAGGASLPNPSSIQWAQLTKLGTPGIKTPTTFGSPGSPVAIDEQKLIFGCQNRLCVLNRTNKAISLVSVSDFSLAKSAEWLTINGVKNILVSNNGALSLLRNS